MQQKVRKVLEYLDSKGVRYADARHEEHILQEIVAENGVLKSITLETSVGTGIRVLYENGWGFAATDEKGNEALMRAAQKALETAIASNRRSKSKVELAEEPVHKANFNSPVIKDPFTVPEGEKVDLLRKVT
ncbi:MAG: TldD/PmbA family protein, partial [Thermotogaceae bacterium]|nr:TldD/PmbA family protein [Thermotogaceae bacterium]